MKRAAKLRLLDLLDPALAELQMILQHDRRHYRGQPLTPRDVLTAIGKVLDKVEKGAPEELQIQVSGVVATAAVDPSQLQDVPTEELEVAQRVLAKLMQLEDAVPLLTGGKRGE